MTTDKAAALSAPPTAGIAEQNLEKLNSASNSDPKSPNSVQELANQDKVPSKLPPCDQCRRRKVKCVQTQDGPCDRCIQSQLQCTREIQRKKRGPKKGSGSVIAKLRGETDLVRAQEAYLPAFNLNSTDVPHSGVRMGEYTADSMDSTPLASPLESQFSDYGQTETIDMPRSVPLGFGNDISPLSAAAFTSAGMSFPAAWQMTEDQPLLQYPSPSSGSGYVSVNDLAHQLFREPLPISAPTLPQQSMAHPTSMPRPISINALLAPMPSAPPSLSDTTASSPRPTYGPRFLYRSDSGGQIIEPRILALASESGLSPRLMSQCVRQWFRVLYSIFPVLYEPAFYTLLNRHEELHTSEKILVLSMCTLTLTHAAAASDMTLHNRQDLARELLKQCLHLRHTYDWIENADLSTIISSFFICNAYFELKQIRSHHFFLREAIGLAREMHSDTTRASNDPFESICRQRMLALLFITERGCAILRNKPISILRLPVIPNEYFSKEDETVLAGFSALCSLFSILDEKFVELWYANSLEDEPTSHVAPLANVATIQHELNRIDFAKTSMTEIQKADVLVTHQWLRLIFWQASMRQGLINSDTKDPVFFYNYPIVIAKDLCSLMRSIDYQAILVHGLGIFEKIFEIAYQLLDALTLAKVDWSSSEDLRYLFSCLSASPNSHSTYVKVLENRISTDTTKSSLARLGAG